MKRSTAFVAVAALVLGSVTAFAQAKPNFAGKWVLAPAPAAAAAPAGGGGGRGGRGGGLGQELTVTQDATTLKLDYVGGGRNPGPVSLTYKLDGSDSTNTVGANEQVAKAVWDGNKLVVTTAINMGGNAVELKRTFSMEGADLIIEQVQPGRDGGPGTPNRMVYKKGM
jgi:hypothetical protein